MKALKNYKRGERAALTSGASLKGLHHFARHSCYFVHSSQSITKSICLFLAPIVKVDKKHRGTQGSIRYCVLRGNLKITGSASVVV